jgi:UDP-glucose 4-epimerase
MKIQEVITIFSATPSEHIDKTKKTEIREYPELDPYFEKGMYVEKITQSFTESGKFSITFVLRYFVVEARKQSTKAAGLIQ